MIPTNPQFYGDDTRWFIGKVISINDPLELGRVRVRIFGLHTADTEQIKESDLPWAQVIIPVTEGGSSGIGNALGIKPQSQVWGIFLDGKNSQLPVILGSIPKIENIESEINEDVPPDPAPTASGVSNIEKAFNFFISAEGGEFTIEQTCGIIGNLLAESNLDPLALNNSEGSFGIAQWNPAAAAGYRLWNLIRFSQDRGYNYTELNPQLEFIKFELYTYSYLGLSKLRETKTARDASRVFEKYYERPAEGSTEIRIAYAEQTLQKMEA